jgi:hypothetical protein
MGFSSTGNAQLRRFALFVTSNASTGLNHVALPKKRREILDFLFVFFF